VDLSVQRPILSIVIPFFSTPENDRTQMTLDLLASIPDRSDVEVILVDDLSDPICQIEPGYNHARFDLCRMEVSTRYAGAARNMGLRRASGMYILCADSDDIFDKASLGKLVDLLARQGDTADRVDVHVVEAREFSGQSIAAAGAPLYGHIDPDLYRCDPAAALVKRHAPWAKVFSRSALGHGVCFREDHIVDDMLFSVRLALAADVAHLHQIPAYYVRRDHGVGALTKKADPETIRMRIDAYREANAALSKGGRGDMVVGMHIPFRRHIRSHPMVVLREAVRSILSRDRIFPINKMKTAK
jgi:glycosyltransferase involved in cell wall biosynthesis